MASEKSNLSYRVGGLLGDIIGWFFCLAVVIGLYSLGYWVAPYVGMAERRDTLGILAVISTIWMYEHQVAHERWTKLLNR